MTLHPQRAVGGDIEDWYVEIDELEHLFLHIDGVVREGVWQNDKFTGYFPTKEAANAAIEAYQKKETDK